MSNINLNFHLTGKDINCVTPNVGKINYYLSLSYSVIVWCLDVGTSLNCYYSIMHIGRNFKFTEPNTSSEAQ